MKILILNGNPDEKNQRFDKYIQEILHGLSEDRNKAEVIMLREKKIIHCTGCWDCWVKNPGECSFPDDTREIRQKAINSDIVVFASPIIAGFISGLMKKVMDKMIPLVHPYITLVKGECHHMKRYKKYPMMGLITDNISHDPDDEIITKDIFNRFALNFKTDLVFSFNILTDPNEVINEIDSY